MIPEGATHRWTPAKQGLIENQLSFYKQVDGEWWVYSPVTDWRKSANPLWWFEEETEEGFFIPIEGE